MSTERERLKTRFDSLFQSGLTNIKFMVIGKPSRDEFFADVNIMQDTIAADEFTLVTSLDSDHKTRKFNEPF